MNIVKKQIRYNYSKRTQSIRYIVIHDTGNTGRGANASAHFNYFNGADRGSSADFFSDDKQILQVNDYTQYYTWHCGDGKGKYGITNANSIGIEICINSDGNYNAAFQNAAELTRSLMRELNIPLERVVRHYDASRKNCPASMSKNSWALWSEFKKRLSEEEIDMEELKKLQAEVDSIKADVGKLKSKMVYAWVDDNMPEWAKPTITKLIRKGYLNGDEHGNLNLDENMLRMLVVNDRAGIYGE